MPRVRVIAGTARSERAAIIDSVLAESPDDSLLIVPTEQHALLRTESFMEATGRVALLDPPVTTFDGMVRRILRGTRYEHARIEPVDQHLLARRSVDRVRQTGALDALGDAANTDGFLDHLLGMIAQLKQAAIEPDEFRRRLKATRRPHPMDGVVADVYDAYQAELRQLDVVDLQGRYWIARDHCSARAPHALAHLRYLLVDEFDDFTPSEFRVIEAMSEHVESITFGLNLDQNPDQKDLYAIPLGTRDDIRSAFPDGVRIDQLDERPPTRTSEFIAASMLVRNDVTLPAPLEEDVELIECHTVDHEIESVGRRIKALIRDRQVEPEEIALVHRRPSSVARAVEHVFAEFGIPIATRPKSRLDATSLAGFLLQFLGAAQSWSTTELTDVLSSPWFIGPDDPHADRFTTLVRAARPRPAQGSWERSVARLADVITTPTGDELTRLARHMPEAVESAKALSAALTQFIGLAETIPATAKSAEYAAALDDILTALPIEAALGAIQDAKQKEYEQAALWAIRRAFFRLHDAERGHGEDRISRVEFGSLLRRTFSLVELGAEFGSGGIAFLDMEAARYLSFDHVFLFGAVDGVVPARAPVNALYSEDERAELRALNVPLEDTPQHDRRELLLFQRVFAVARRRLTISWHRVDRDGGATQRSLYLEEIAERLRDLAVTRPANPREVLVPTKELVAGTRDVRNLLFGFRATKAGATAFPETAAAAAVEAERQSGNACGTRDGVLGAARNLELIAKEFGPDIEFSATALESYASCPFHFFQERILRLFRVEPAEPTLDALVQGRVLHRALEKFHASHRGAAIGDIPVDVADTSMRDALDIAFTDVTRGQVHLSRGLLEAEKAKIARMLRQYLAIARETDDPAWKPVQFETAFGRARDDDDTPLPPFRLELDDGAVLLTGRIDRIDEANGGIRIVDYKSSVVQPAEILNRRAFQLALYALAAESVVRPGEMCDSALYLAVGREKGKTVALERAGKKSNWDERVALAQTAVETSLAGIRTGKFHPTFDDHPCSRCPDEKICRYQRARMQRKAAE